MILFEPARYPVAYFPIGDIDQGVLQPSDHESTHPDLGKTKWFNVVGGDGDRNLSVDEIGGIQLVEDAAAAET